jgi:hypothetical protein
VGVGYVSLWKNTIWHAAEIVEKLAPMQMIAPVLYATFTAPGLPTELEVKRSF